MSRSEPAIGTEPEVVSPQRRVSELSLFDGDLVNRIFGWLGLGPRRPRHLVGRALLLIALTWVPLAILAVWGRPPFYGTQLVPGNFFADFAAYAQFLLGLPLFVLAEAIVGTAASDAGSEFVASGIVRPRDLGTLERLHRRVAFLRTSSWGELSCLTLGYAFSLAILVTEFRDAKGNTWHTYVEQGVRHVSAPGLWEFFVALPLLNYWWLRQLWRIAVWCYYLFRLSRLRLALVATHPDRTGGIGFISTAQGHFAWVILAYGVSNVAATVGYELAIERVDPWIPPVWGPVLGFVIIAPLSFLLPLFMFTRQLYRTKRRARRLYRARVMEYARLFESTVLPQAPVARATPSTALDLGLMARFSELFERCEHMRVVPFDFRSMSELFISTLGTVATILPALRFTQLLSQLLSIAGKLGALFAHPVR